MRQLRATVSARPVAPPPPVYRPYTLRDLGRIPQLTRLPRALRREIELDDLCPAGGEERFFFE